MTDISGIQSLLDNVRFILMIDKPAVVRDLKFNVDFRDHVVDQKHIREGVVSAYVETDTHYLQKDLYSYVASCGDTKSVEDADGEILTYMRAIWETMTDREEYNDIWEKIRFGSEEWKRKEK